MSSLAIAGASCEKRSAKSTPSSALAAAGGALPGAEDIARRDAAAAQGNNDTAIGKEKYLHTTEMTMSTKSRCMPRVDATVRATERAHSAQDGVKKNFFFLFSLRGNLRRRA